MKVKLIDSHPSKYVKVIVDKSVLFVGKRFIEVDDSLEQHFLSDVFEVEGVEKKIKKEEKTLLSKKDKKSKK